MSYAVAADLIARFSEAELSQLTDDAGLGVVDAATVGRAVDDASALIDSYLVGRYVLPLASTPAMLVGLCCDLARYALYVDAAPEIVKERRDAAMAQLRDLAAGRARLDVAVPSASPSGRVEVVSGERIFNRGGR